MKQPRATKADIDEIKSGHWDSWGDIGELLQRLRFSLADAQAETEAAKRVSRDYYRQLDEVRNP